ncbi:DUF3289 family protein [Vibrio sagamiensis]|uniref:DUF3289 family protein n=1 Tax=Vibrio sagamiensis TaxID=512650 RepID=UPI001D12D715
MSNGGVLTVHGIWAIEVYIDNLEFRGKEVRGKFRYDIQDHFGLDTNDINHRLASSHKAFELFKSFRSWYLLQHYTGYGFKPFITQMNFTLTN